MRYWKAKKVAGDPCVGIGVATYLNGEDRRLAALEGLVASFRAQTWPHWRLLLCHDGPLKAEHHAAVKHLTTDRRVRWHETADRLEKFGHPHRQWQIDQLSATCGWLGLTNDDNWYAPVYLEWLLRVATTTKRCDFVYCDMVHSHKMWKPLKTAPRRGQLDLGGWLAKSTLCRKLKFDNFSFSGDGDYINRLRLSAQATQKVDATLFVHN